MSTEYLPARLRIRYYQQESERLYWWARHFRDTGKNKLARMYQRAAARDSAKGRRLLFAMIDGGHSRDYTGPL